MPPLGPLLLKPIFLRKVWAPPRLPEPWQSILGPPPQTGEVWLASDRHRVSTIAHGELAGLGLDQVVSRWPREILGSAAGRGLPLLLKLLCTCQWLSVQVHPDDQAARKLENEPWGKSEAWHILDAEPGAQIIHGLPSGARADQVPQALARDHLADLLARVPVRAGDTFEVPAGTVHSPGPGLLILEVQQSSDITYRFYDWDRLGDDGRPRRLHIDKALAVLRPSPAGHPRLPRQLAAPPAEVLGLADNPFFQLNEARLAPGTRRELADTGPRLLFIARGGGRLAFAGEAHDLAPGQCWLLPAALAGAQLQTVGQGLDAFISLAKTQESQSP